MVSQRMFSVEVLVGLDPESGDLDLRCLIDVEEGFPGDEVVAAVPHLLRTCAERVQRGDITRIVDKGPAARPCPECAGGKCINCTDTVPLDDDLTIWETCACKEAGHVR